MLVLFVSFSFDPITAETVNQINQNYCFVISQNPLQGLDKCENCYLSSACVFTHSLFSKILQIGWTKHFSFSTVELENCYVVAGKLWNLRQWEISVQFSWLCVGPATIKATRHLILGLIVYSVFGRFNCSPLAILWHFLINNGNCRFWIRNSRWDDNIVFSKDAENFVFSKFLRVNQPVILGCWYFIFSFFASSDFCLLLPLLLLLLLLLLLFIDAHMETQPK